MLVKIWSVVFWVMTLLLLRITDYLQDHSVATQKTVQIDDVLWNWSVTNISVTPMCKLLLSVCKKLCILQRMTKVQWKNVQYFLKIKAQLSRIMTLNFYLHVCQILWYSTTLIFMLVNMRCWKGECKLNSTVRCVCNLVFAVF